MEMTSKQIDRQLDENCTAKHSEGLIGSLLELMYGQYSNRDQWDDGTMIAIDSLLSDFGFGPKHMNGE